MTTTSEPPTEPKDTGWRQPSSKPGTVGRWDAVVRVLGLGVAMALVVTAITAQVWSTCDDLPPGGGFTISFGLFPILTIVIAAAIALGVTAMFRRPPRERSLVGIALGVVVSVGLVMFLVDGGAGVIRPIDPLYPECGTNGLPAWWPTWLPN